MTNNTGNLIYSTLRPSTSADTFAVAFSNEIKGGLHNYSTLLERDSIPSERRQLWMKATVGNTTYFLSGGTSNTNWVVDTNIINQTYGISWSGDILHTTTRNDLYNVIQSIGLASGNIAYVDSTGGNDSSAQVGNLIKPYQTIGNAIISVSGLTNSTLIIRSGTYNMYDTDSPFGLKVPTSVYDIIVEAGATINYYGTYGLFILNDSLGTSGNLLSKGTIKCYGATFSGTIDGVNNYCINVNNSVTSRKLEFDWISTESITSTANLLRVGSCISTGYNLVVNNRILSRGGTTLFFDTNSRTSINNITVLISTSTNNSIPIKINEPISLIFNNLINSQFYGNAFGSNQTSGVTITNETNGDIRFQNCLFNAVSSPSNYKMINLNNITSNYSNVIFKDCLIKNRLNSTFISSGTSFYCNNDISFKIINSYSDQDINGAILTNLITVGNGLFYQPNL